VRLEVGPKDIEKSQVLSVRRDNRNKVAFARKEVVSGVQTLLSEIQQELFDRACRFREEYTVRTTSYEEFKKIMAGRPGFVISPWCGETICEAAIKAETQATIRNLPMSGLEASVTCVRCEAPAREQAYFAKSY
jgi:prolyl-tRNA synthetase